MSNYIFSFVTQPSKQNEKTGKSLKIKKKDELPGVFVRAFGRKNNHGKHTFVPPMYIPFAQCEKGSAKSSINFCASSVAIPGNPSD